MSLYIASAILKAASSVNVTLSLDKLGQRQRTSLARMLKTGHIKGEGVPAFIAKRIRIQEGLPVICFAKHNFFKWENIRTDSLDDFFDRFTAGGVVGRMQEGTHAWMHERWMHENIDSAIQERLQTGAVWGSKYFVQVMKTYKMPAYEGVVRNDVVIDMMKE